MEPSIVFPERISASRPSGIERNHRTLMGSGRTIIVRARDIKLVARKATRCPDKEKGDIVHLNLRLLTRDFETGFKYAITNNNK